MKSITYLSRTMAGLLLWLLACSGSAFAAPLADIEILSVSPRDVAQSPSDEFDEVASGLNAVGVGQKVYLKAMPAAEGATISRYEWSIVNRRTSGVAELSSASGTLVTFRPDAEGNFLIALVPYDENSSPTEAVFQTLYAAQWVGAGVFDTHDPESPGIPECGNACCHGDDANGRLNVLGDWAQSRHASKLQSHLNGSHGDHYSVSCLPCHTLGFNDNPNEGSNGFDDLAGLLGFDLNLIPNLVAEAAQTSTDKFPELPGPLQNHASIQCESCHGAGSQHLANIQAADHGIAGVDLEEKQCAQCHDSASGFQQGFYQWRGSAHTATFAVGDGHAGEDIGCVKCHTGEGFVDIQVNGEPGEVVEHPHGITCSACHDPHFSDHPHQLRLSGAFTFDSGQNVQDPGTGGLCMRCHNARVADPIQTATTSRRGAHYGTQADMLQGVNAVDFGIAWAYNTPHRQVVKETCAGCHMAKPSQSGPGIADPPTVGGHTFALRDNKGTPENSDDELNVENACGECHSGLQDYDRTARGDYDGDGSLEGIQSEVRGLFDLLRPLILASLTGSTLNATSGKIEIPQTGFDNLTPDQKMVLYNYNFVWLDGSFGVHNAGFAVQILQRSYGPLVGRLISDDYPLMDIRGPLTEDQVEPTPTPTTDGYIGSSTCIICHYEETLHWRESLHANIYRDPLPENFLPDFTGEVVLSDPAKAIPPITFTLGGGRTGPFTVSFLGQTYTVDRVHGGKAIAENIDPRDPELPGHSEFIGKQRYQTKIGDAYYVFPLQWNPVPNLDGKSQGWENYHLDYWVNSAGAFALNLKTRSESTNCSGCHQTGVNLSFSSETQQFSVSAIESVISCEACHGPGYEHSQTTDPDKVVNPKDLPYERANEVCTACHGRYKSTGTLEGTRMEFPFKDNEIFRPGDTVSEFVTDAGGYWPDGTSKQHHQQGEDYARSGHHANSLPCWSCHNPHENKNEHMLDESARDNTLCLSCHADEFPDDTAVGFHTGHSPKSPLGPRCVDCHMPAVQKSAVEYDIHAHTFQVLLPQDTLDTGVPNSCAILCHNTSPFGIPIHDAGIANWSDCSDQVIAGILNDRMRTIGHVYEPGLPVAEGYVGSQTCSQCHNEIYANWNESLHAAIYRDPLPENILPEFSGEVVIGDPANGIPPITFTLGGGRTGPFTVSFLGNTYPVDRVHGGKPIKKNRDPRDPELPGHTSFIGKQRYQTKIGDAYYILPTQWNPAADLDGKNRGWVNYDIHHWVNTSGANALNLKTRSESTRCSGCHQTGVNLTFDAGTNQFSVHAVDSVVACESCHGPGLAHASLGDPLLITNPNDLPVDRANEVCGQCHGRYKSVEPLDGVTMEFPYKDGKTYRPGETLANFVTDAGGYWADGTSKQHHQQYHDYLKSGHSTTITCFACHNPHRSMYEHDSVVTARDNTLCLRCHSDEYSSAAVIETHTGHPASNPESPRCVDCHMSAVQKSGVNYDIHAHTFDVLLPQGTLDKQIPNSCAIACHRENRLGEGAVDTNVGNWSETSDQTIANWLITNFNGIGQAPSAP